MPPPVTDYIGHCRTLMPVQEINFKHTPLMILTKAVCHLLQKPGSRHCHLVIGHCTIRQRVFDCKYLSCKICFNALNYVQYLFYLFLIFTVEETFNSIATILARDVEIVFSCLISNFFSIIDYRDAIMTH